MFTDAEDLQNIVNAYEFVSAHRSVQVAKKYCDLHDPYGTSNHYNNLRAKIELVESVNGFQPSINPNRNIPEPPPPPPIRLIKGDKLIK